MNNFALYTSTKDIGNLEKARKNIDDAYKTKKDSLGYRNNLIRALVYSSLAFEDAQRKFKYNNDPIIEAKLSLGCLKNPRLNYDHEPEISFAKKQLAKAYIIKANKAVTSLNYPEAYSNFIAVDSLDEDNYQVKYNLAVVCEKLGHINQAVHYYEQLIKDKDKSQPDYYLSFSNLYETSRNSGKSLEVLLEGRKVFPGNKDILFKVINIYSDNGDYQTVQKLADDALQLDPDNVNLIYLAGFSAESLGKTEKAEELYKKVIEVEQNSYQGHYSLGLLYLNLYLEGGKDKDDKINQAKRHLLLAGDINPNSINVLKALSVLYSKTGNMIELQRVNNKLKQFIFN
ncbi:tetratricopeptide repeat protein [Desertivirga arenae]|uniref:tetratricopeptide repeat protein n=1 Tax=Desertivirga arenae TaxID=2810309 RepID=UPI001A97AE9B|nr:tetratricopeptide repeat protein [Pedobacter sp. SYSU D00823]